MNNKLLKLLFITASFQASAEVKPAALFTDNLIDKPVAVKYDWANNPDKINYI